MTGKANPVTASAPNSLARVGSLALICVVLCAFATSLHAGDKALDKAVKNHDVDGIVTRMLDLAKDDPGAAVKHIPAAFAKVEKMPWKSFYDEDRYRVFRAAITALSRIKDSDPISKMTTAFRTSKDWQARLLILHVALRQEKMDSQGLAVQGLQDKAPLVVALAARTLGNTEDVKMLTPLLNAMERWETESNLEKVAEGRKKVEAESGGRAWLACRDALHKLTGRSYHRHADYRNFITTHRDQIDPKKPPIDPLDDKRTGVGLFGLDITGRNIIFILDISGSMNATDPPTPEQLEKIRGRTVVKGERDKLLEELMESRRRIVRAKKELVNVVNSLGEDRRFNLIVYSSEVKSWEKRLLSAEDKVKKKAVTFIEALKPTGVTFTDEALEAALLDPYVDTIYLITDGAPTHLGSQGNELPQDAPELMERILKFTRATNYLRNVRLFTLGFAGAKEEWLTALATENHGKYHRIE